MIFVAGTMTLPPEDIPDLQRDVLAMIDKVREEPGCHHYSILVEDAGAGLVNVLEQWADDAALIAVHRLRASTVRVFDIAGSRPLPGA